MGESEDRRVGFADLVDRVVPMMARFLTTLAYQDPIRTSFSKLGSRLVYEVSASLKERKLTDHVVASLLDMSRYGYRSMVQRFDEEHGDGFDASPPMTQRLHDLLLDGPLCRVDLEERILEQEKEARAGRGDQREKGLQSVVDEVRAVLRYLEQREVVVGAGANGPGRRYRLAWQQAESDPLDALQVELYRATSPQTAAELERRLGLSRRAVMQGLDLLRERAALVEHPGAKGETRYTVNQYHLGPGLQGKFATALFDHLKVVLDSIGAKLDAERFSAELDDLIGGTTYTFHLPVGHPLHAEVTGFLAQMREQMPRWRDEAQRLADERRPGQAWHKVTIYTGQVVEDYEAPTP